MEGASCNNLSSEENLNISNLQTDENKYLELEEQPEINIFFVETHFSNLSTLNLKNITKLVVIGQPITYLEALRNTELLKELWLPDCSIKKIENLEYCFNLQKLYLYSNQIIQIEGLDSLKGLVILSLSENSITEIKNMSELEELQELYLSGNQIKYIGESLSNNKNLKTLNLSGNPIHNINDILHLPVVENLELSDTVYKKCPIVSLCNYRSLVILQMPYLKYLDSFSVHIEERADTLEYLCKKNIYYNAIQNQSKCKYYCALNELQKDCDIRREKYKECLCLLKAEEIQSNMQCFSSLGDIPSTFTEAKQESIWSEIRNMCFKEELEKSLIEQEYKILVPRINMELHHGGNIKFIKHSPEKSTSVDFQKILNSFTCQNVFSQLEILSVKVTDVTEIINKELELMQHYLCSYNNTEETWGYYLLSGFYDTKGIDLWQNSLAENGFLYLSEKSVTITNCIATSDYEWLLQMKIGCDSSFGYYKHKIKDRRTAILVKAHSDNLSPELQEEIYLCHDKRNQCSSHCQKYKVKCKDLLIPVLIIEYVYEFMENIEKQKQPQDKAHTFGLSNKNQTSQATELRILDINTLSLKVPKEIWHTLSKLSLQAIGIETIAIPVCLPNIRTVDLSYNNLLTLGGLDNFPNVTYVDVSFNKIHSVADMAVLKNLKRLDISWNHLGSTISVINTLKRCTPCLKNLEMSFNPVTDVKNNIHKMCLARKDLFLLHKINGEFVERSVKVVKSITEVSPKISLEFKFEQLNKLTTSWKCDQIYHLLGCTDCLTLDINNDFCFVWNNKQIDLIDCADELTMGKIWQKLRWANFNNNYIMSMEFLNHSLSLEELSISSNLINVIDGTLLKLNRLVKLDISNNYISSISCLSKSYFPKLEVLNISNNLIKNLSGIEACPALIELYSYHNIIGTLDDLNGLLGCTSLVVVDLSSNKVEKAENFRTFLSFHLPVIEIINGKYEKHIHTQDMNNFLGNCLDKNFLIKRNKDFDTNSITELTLDNCSLKKINLKPKTLPNLTSLDLSNNKITSIWGLQELSKLETLCLSHNCVTSITTDKQIIQSLEERMTTLEQDSHLPSLTQQGSLITGTSFFPQLKTLYLNNNGINSLIPLYIDRMKNLQTLFLHGNKLSCIRGLANAKELKHLVLDGNRIESIDKLEVKNITNLEDLYLEINRIKDLSFITNFRSLRRIYLSRNRINECEQVKHLECLQCLEEITLYGNPLFRKTDNYHMLQYSLPSIKRIDGIYLNLELNEKN